MFFQIDIEKHLTARGRRFTLKSSFTADSSRLALFGPSGSGKTLTLMALAGLLKPERGRIAVGERVLFDSGQGVWVAPRMRRVGIVFQDYALFPHLSVRQNVAFGLKRLLRPLSRDAALRVDELLELFGLADLAGSLPGDISGGQRQRTALARAVAPRPELLLLDEPFSALDQPLRERMRLETRKLLDHFGIPVVLVTHDPEDVRALAHIVAVYDLGRVRRVAGVEDGRVEGEANDASWLASEFRETWPNA